MTPTAAGGLGDRSSSPSGSGRSPTAKPFLVIFWFENEVWDAPKLSHRFGRSPTENMHFYLKTKFLAMTDLEVTLLIHLRSFHVLSPLPISPHIAAKRRLLQLETAPFHGTHCG